eukprot:2912489-Pyramimonas_sp.AAC.1
MKAVHQENSMIWYSPGEWQVCPRGRMTRGPSAWAACYYVFGSEHWHLQLLNLQRANGLIESIYQLLMRSVSGCDIAN